MHETAILLHTSNRGKKGTREGRKGAREGKKGTREGKKGAREGKKGAAPFYFGLAGTLFFSFVILNKKSGDMKICSTKKKNIFSSGNMNFPGRTKTSCFLTNWAKMLSIGNLSI